jgi:anti-anti-sigma regulatory factor
MKSMIIHLNSYFNRSISTRAAIQNLFTFDKTEAEEIIFDFSGINFVSSSASHQFYLEVKKLESQDKTISFINVIPDVDKMLVLAKSDRKNIFTVQKIEHLNVTSDKDLSQLLLQI